MKPSTTFPNNKRSGGDGTWVGALAKTVLILLFWLLLWQAAYQLVGKAVVLPSPYGTFSTLLRLIWTKGFYLDVSATMIRVLLGIVISFALGLFTAVAAYLIPVLEEVLRFAVQFLKSTPVMAVIIFALLWLNSDQVPVFVCFLMCYPVVYTNILSGLDSLHPEYIEMCRIFRIRRRDMVRFVYIPFVSPHIKSALSLTTGLSWKTVVAAEVLASPKFSMGYNLLNAKVYLETESLFAWIIAIVSLSLVFEKAVRLILTQDKRRQPHD